METRCSVLGRTDLGVLESLVMCKESARREGLRRFIDRKKVRGSEAAQKNGERDDVKEADSRRPQHPRGREESMR